MIHWLDGCNLLANKSVPSISNCDNQFKRPCNHETESLSYWSNNETQLSNFDHFSRFQTLKTPLLLYRHFFCVYSRIFVPTYWNRGTIICVESFTLAAIVVPHVVKNATFCPSISRFFDFSFFLSKTSLSTVATIRLHPLDHGDNNIGGWRFGHAASKHAG